MSRCRNIQTWHAMLSTVSAAIICCAFTAPVWAQDSRAVPDLSRSTPASGVLVIFLTEITFVPGRSAISDEDTIVECINRGLRTGNPKRRIISYDEFRVIAFPELARKASPRRPEYLGILLRQPEFRRRIAPLGIRYIVFVGGATETSSARGGGFCGYGDRGGGCLALVYWNRRSELAANIVDITGRPSPGTITSTRTGTAWLAIIGFVPLGMPAFTQSATCSDLGARVARKLPPTDRE